jgi:hypothetical protein
MIHGLIQIHYHWLHYLPATECEKVLRLSAGGKRGTGFEISEHYLAMLTGNPTASLSIPI